MHFFRQRDSCELWKLTEGNCHVACCNVPHFTPAELAHGLSEVFCRYCLCIFMRGRDWHCQIVASLNSSLKLMYKTDRFYACRTFLAQVQALALEEPCMSPSRTSPNCDNCLDSNLCVVNFSKQLYKKRKREREKFNFLQFKFILTKSKTKFNHEKFLIKFHPVTYMQNISNYCFA